MDKKQLYWSGPGSLQWKRGEKLLQPNDLLTPEMVKIIGEKSIKDLCTKKQIAELTPAVVHKQAGGNLQAAFRKAQEQIAALTEERDKLATEIEELLEKEPASDKDYKKLLKNFNDCKKDFGELHEKCTDLKGDYDLVVTNINQLNDENQKLLKNVNQLKEENQKLIEKHKKGVDDWAEKFITLGKIKTELEETKKYNKSLHRENAKLKKKSGVNEVPDSIKDSDLPLDDNQQVGPTQKKE